MNLRLSEPSKYRSSQFNMPGQTIPYSYKALQSGGIALGEFLAPPNAEKRRKYAKTGCGVVPGESRRGRRSVDIASTYKG